MKPTKIEFEIEGISPLLMDKWIDEKQPKTEKGYIEQAELKAYRDEKGNLSIPANAIKACMRFASSELGKRMEAKKNRQSIKAGVFFDKEYFSIGKKKHDGIARHIISRGVGEKVTRVPTYRPMINEGWSIKGQMINYGLPTEFLKEALELGGFKYGLLSYRPEHGRYIVKNFEVVENGKD